MTLCVCWEYDSSSVAVVHEEWNLSEWNGGRGRTEGAFCYLCLHRPVLRLAGAAGCVAATAGRWQPRVGQLPFLDVIGFTWVAGGTHFSGLMPEPLYTSRLLPHLLHALSIRLSDLPAPSPSTTTHDCFFSPSLLTIFVLDSDGQHQLLRATWLQRREVQSSTTMNFQ